jgi:hypothetical protein
MGNGSDIFDEGDPKSCGLQSSKGGLPSGAGSFDQHIDGSHPLVHGLARGIFSRELGSKGRRLPRSFESLGAGRGPGHGFAFRVGDGHDRVVERRLDMRNPVRNIAFFLLLALDFPSWHLPFLIFCPKLFDQAGFGATFELGRGRPVCLFSCASLSPDPGRTLPCPSTCVSRSAASSVPCAYAHWCGCAGPEPEVRGGDEVRDSSPGP